MAENETTGIRLEIPNENMEVIERYQKAFKDKFKKRITKQSVVNRAISNGINLIALDAETMEQETILDLQKFS